MQHRWSMWFCDTKKKRLTIFLTQFTWNTADLLKITRTCTFQGMLTLISLISWKLNPRSITQNSIQLLWQIEMWSFFHTYYICVQIVAWKLYHLPLIYVFTMSVTYQWKKDSAAKEFWPVNCLWILKTIINLSFRFTVHESLLLSRRKRV